MKIQYQNKVIESDDPIITGGDLKAMRVAAGTTIDEAADALQLKSRQTIRNWEAGSSQASINSFVLLAMFYGFDAAKVMSACTLRTLENRQKAGPRAIEWDACKLNH